MTNEKQGSDYRGKNMDLMSATPNASITIQYEKGGKKGKTKGKFNQA